MRRILAAIIALSLVVGACDASHQPRRAARAIASATSSPRHEPAGRDRTHHGTHAGPEDPAPHPVGVPAADMPNASLTPGVALAVDTAQVCRSGYASSVRDVPDPLKSAVYARYGIAWVPYRHEVDHLISLELGGSNSIENLWPEPYAGRWGARTKDALENRLHDLVCSGSLSLARAQHQEATNWVAAYRRYVGAALGGSGSGRGSSAGGYYASSYPSADTIYCANDPGWRTLSSTYLVHFATWARAHARFPTYHLHQPC